MNYNTSVIRPEVSDTDIEFRGDSLSREKLLKIYKALITLHTLETMAANLYKFQISGSRSELDKKLIAAMLNELSHIQDFQVKLYEYGFKPSKFRGAFWIVGFVIGFGSRLLGEKAVLKAGIWVENKAVEHYGELLDQVDWDDETRSIIERDRADEEGHINSWKEMLDKINLSKEKKI